MRQVEARGVTLEFSHTNPFAQLAFREIFVPDIPQIECAFPDKHEAGKWWLKNMLYELFPCRI